jgi:peptide/nickel transport system permease protein
VVGAAVIWVIVSILTGVAAALLKGTVFDPLLMILALIGISMPVFWLGEVANLITQSRMHDSFLFSWVPPLGYTPLTEDPVLWFKHLVVPWLVLSVLYVGFYARVLRANLLEVQNEDYVRTARAKGLRERAVVLRHALRPALGPTVSLSALLVAEALAGSVIVERIYRWRGMGTFLLDALNVGDTYAVLGYLVVVGVVVSLANLVADIVQAVLDPRIRR